MNPLIDNLPSKVMVNGDVHDINCNYRTCIKIMLACEDESLTDLEKNVVLVKLLYKEQPTDFNMAVKQGVKFLDAGKEQQSSVKVATSKKKRLYSFEKDSQYIFTGVDESLNGRLSKGELVHWWTFLMAFMEIPEHCMISKIISIRSKKYDNKLSKEEARIYRKNLELFELKAPKKSLMTDEQEENANKFMELMNDFGS